MNFSVIYNAMIKEAKGNAQKTVKLGEKAIKLLEKAEPLLKKVKAGEVTGMSAQALEKQIARVKGGDTTSAFNALAKTVEKATNTATSIAPTRGAGNAAKATEGVAKTTEALKGKPVSSEVRRMWNMKDGEQFLPGLEPKQSDIWPQHMERVRNFDSKLKLKEEEASAAAKAKKLLDETLKEQPDLPLDFNPAKAPKAAPVVAGGTEKGKPNLNAGNGMAKWVEEEAAKAPAAKAPEAAPKDSKPVSAQKEQISARNQKNLENREAQHTGRNLRTEAEATSKLDDLGSRNGGAMEGLSGAERAQYESELGRQEAASNNLNKTKTPEQQANTASRYDRYSDYKRKETAKRVATDAALAGTALGTGVAVGSANSNKDEANSTKGEDKPTAASGSTGTTNTVETTGGAGAGTPASKGIMDYAKQYQPALIGAGAGLAGAGGLYALGGAIPAFKKKKLLRAMTALAGGAGIGYGAYALSQPKTASYKEFKNSIERG